MIDLGSRMARLEAMGFRVVERDGQLVGTKERMGLATTFAREIVTVGVREVDALSAGQIDGDLAELRRQSQKMTPTRFPFIPGLLEMRMVVLVYFTGKASTKALGRVETWPIGPWGFGGHDLVHVQMGEVAHVRKGKTIQHYFARTMADPELDEKSPESSKVQGLLVLLVLIGMVVAFAVCLAWTS